VGGGRNQRGTVLLHGIGAVAGQFDSGGLRLTALKEGGSGR